MHFKELSGYFSTIEKTQSRLEMTEILARLFKKISSDEISCVLYLLQGKIAPLFVKSDFGMGEKMVEEALKNDLDWRLLPAIAVRESTGGKHECKRVPNNAFGWGSCKISFKSNEQAIETVALNLGGNKPNTARHYDEKTVIEILRAYNPPSIVPKYAEQVMAIMDVIGDENLTASLAVAD